MDDSEAMGGGKRVGNFDRDRQGLVERQRSFLESRGERLAFQILHHQEVDTVLVTHVVERADVRMGERRDGLRLAVETRAELRIGGERARQHLQRDRTIETRVGRVVHLAHSASAEQAIDAVRAEHACRIPDRVGSSRTAAAASSIGRSIRSWRLLLREQRFNLAPELVVAGARLGQKRASLFRPRSRTDS